MSKPVFVVHDSPLGREAPYYIAQFELNYAGLPGQVEQLWLNELGEGIYRVACVPFCAEGLSYLDLVELDVEGRYVTSLHERSGHRVLRALIGRLSDDDVEQVKQMLVSAADRAGTAYEWHGERLVAFDVAPGAAVDELLVVLSREAAAGSLQFDWTDDREFSHM